MFGAGMVLPGFDDVICIFKSVKGTSYIRLLNFTNPDTQPYTLCVLILDAVLNVKNSYNVSLNEAPTSVNTVKNSPKCNGLVLNIATLILLSTKYCLNRNESVINISVDSAYFLSIFTVSFRVEPSVWFFVRNSLSPKRKWIIEYGEDNSEYDLVFSFKYSEKFLFGVNSCFIKYLHSDDKFSLQNMFVQINNGSLIHNDAL